MLEAEFARVDMILEDRVDGLMEQFKDSGTTFYSDYKKADASSTPVARNRQRHLSSASAVGDATMAPQLIE